ncbi:hypothetical protein MACK_003134 [Theileria orientalis]|uniref:Uncharacterized protein n=1 Tax=Theileria orientalis TaxID=68886 RepID=A0A976ME75_THEOR|nr:hypothetical protein MACK_003134 [Theileria orientalis]
MLVIVKFKVYHYNIYKQFGDKWELVYSTFTESGSRKKQDKQILRMELNRNRENEETESKADSLNKNLESEEIENNIVKSGGNTNSELITRMQNNLERTKTEIDIDINSKKSNQFYSYSHDPFQGVDSYECKDNYKIKLVKRGIHDLWENKEDIDAVCVDIYHKRKIESSSDDSDDEKDNISNPDKMVVIVYFEGGLRSLTVKNDPGNPNGRINNIEEGRTNEDNGEEIGREKDNNKHEVLDIKESIPTSDEELADDNVERCKFYGVSQKM